MIILKEEDRKYKTDILASDPDAQLREQTCHKANGSYAIQICRKCYDYFCSPPPEGNIATAKIVDKCSTCLAKDNGVL